jgi:hypothetical protein
MAEERVFTSKDKDGGEVEVKFNDLNQVVLSRGDFIYREYFSKAIRAGVMTNAEALKILKDRDVWGETQEKEVVDLQVQLYELESELKKRDKRDATSLSLYDRIKEVRRDMQRASNVRSNVLDNTAESMAAEMRTQFFASECSVYNNTGQRVFSDLKDFLARLDESVATDSYRQALIINYEKALGITLPKDLSETSLPEDEWLNGVRTSEEEKAEKPKKAAKKRKPRKKKATATK